MKDKQYFTTIFFLFSIISFYAQNNYSYYYKGQKVYLTLDKTNISISTYDDFEKSSISTSDFKDFNTKVENTSGQNNMYANIEFKKSPPSDVQYFQKINLLNNNPKIIKAQPSFRNSSGIKIGMSDYFYVKLKDLNDLDILQKLSIKKNIQIIEQNEFMPLWFTLKCKKNAAGSTLEIANFFFETGLFVSAVPDFLADDLLCTNDANFGSLWGLNNNVNPNFDINICQAWGIAQGNGIKVAVLDQGIELTHLDLTSNIYPLSYNTETNSSPSQVFGNHGTHVAGTIAAIKNNIQVVGVSPLSKLMSVSNSLASTPNSRIKRADGINWAHLNGADIINNSWGSAVQYQVIDDAIENAITNGRSGKGTIIVFASGNNNGAISYPANVNSKIISVGAITSNGRRSSFSNYGSQLDVVAPGSGILSTTLNNSTGSMDGTSMAAPHVAGVCALILSKNPCLTGQQVRDIIEKTAQKVGGYSYTTTAGRANGTWNNQMGYGLVDAFAAVQMAQSLSLSAQISGLNTLCSTATYSAITSGATSYNWTITQGSNLVTLSGNGTSTVNLTALPNTLGLVTLSLTVGGTCEPLTVTKSIQVGGGIVTNPGVVIGQSPLSSNETSAFSYSGGANASSYRWFIYGGINDGVGPEGGAYITSYQLGGRLVNIDTGSIASNLVIGVEAVSECNVVIDTAFMFVEVTSSMARFAAASTSSIITTFPNPLTASNELQVNVVQTKDTSTTTTTATKVSAKAIDNQVKIYDLQGNLKYSGSFKTDNMSIKNLNFKQGNYILNVTTNSGEQLKTILIVK